jgi:hypothetical protein
MLDLINPTTKAQKSYLHYRRHREAHRLPPGWTESVEYQAETETSRELITVRLENPEYVLYVNFGDVNTGWFGDPKDLLYTTRRDGSEPRASECLQLARLLLGEAPQPILNRFGVLRHHPTERHKFEYNEDGVLGRSGPQGGSAEEGRECYALDLIFSYPSDPDVLP